MIEFYFTESADAPRIPDLFCSNRKYSINQASKSNEMRNQMACDIRFRTCTSLHYHIAAQYENQIEEKIWQIEKTSVQLYSYLIERYIYAWCGISDEIRSKNVFETQVPIIISGSSFLRGVPWYGPKRMWTMYFSRDSIFLIFLNAPKSKNFIFGSFSVEKLITCKFF